MKLERIKNIVLLALIACSIFLTARIWFSYELWPYDTGFVAAVKNSSLAQGIARIFPSLGRNVNISRKGLYSIYTPERFVLTDNARKTVMTSSHERFRDLNRASNELLTVLFSDNPTLVEASDAEWQAPLKSKAILVDYTYPISTALYGQFLAGKEFAITQQVTSFSKIVLSLSDTASGQVTIYIKDDESRKFYCATVNYENKADLSALLLEAVKDAEDRYTFAFEINLDKTPEDADETVSRNVILDSLVLLPLLESDVQPIKKSARTQSENNGRAQELLNLFGYNASSFRRLADKDGNLLFVENFSTLKITADGTIEYRATDQTKGISLRRQAGADGSIKSQYEIIGNATNFVNDLWEVLSEDGSQTEIRIASPVVENRTGNYTLVFTYYFNGLPVYSDQPSGAFIEMQIQDGRIVSYRQTVRSYEKTGQIGSGRPVMDAIDDYYAQMEDMQNIVVVKNIILSYWDDANGSMMPDWSVVRDDGNIIGIQQ